MNYFLSPQKIRLILCGLLFLFILSATVNGSENNAGTGSSLIQSSGNFTRENSYITIDPIQDRYVGDSFSLSGTTNISPRVPIRVEVFYSSYHALGKQQPGEYIGTDVHGVNAIITENAGSPNSWSAIIDTREYNWSATENDWIVVVTPRWFNTSQDSHFANQSTFKFQKGVRPTQLNVTFHDSGTAVPISSPKLEMATTVPAQASMPIWIVMIALSLLAGCLRKEK